MSIQLFKTLASLVSTFTPAPEIAAALNKAALFTMRGGLHTPSSITALLNSLRNPDRYPSTASKALSACNELTADERFTLTSTTAKIRTNNFLKGTK